MSVYLGILWYFACYYVSRARRYLSLAEFMMRVNIHNYMCIELAPRLRGPEHDICPANKFQITNNCNFFLAQHT